MKGWELGGGNMEARTREVKKGVQGEAVRWGGGERERVERDRHDQKRGSPKDCFGRHKSRWSNQKDYTRRRGGVDTSRGGAAKRLPVGGARTKQRQPKGLRGRGHK